MGAEQCKLGRATKKEYPNSTDLFLHVFDRPEDGLLRVDVRSNNLNMEINRKIPWPRILAEGTAIVVSILLAFGIEAWWQDRIEKQQVDDALITVLEELALGSGNVESARKVVQTRVDAYIELYKASLDGHEDVDVESVDQLLAHVFWYADAYPIGVSGIQGLLESGLLESIRSVVLRANLADWPRRVAAAERSMLSDRVHFNDVVHPYLLRHGDRAQLELYVTHVPGFPSQTVEQFPYAVDRGFDHSQLLSDREFQNIIVQSWAILVQILTVYDSLNDKLDQTIQLIQQELEK